MPACLHACMHACMRVRMCVLAWSQGGFAFCTGLPRSARALFDRGYLTWVGVVLWWACLLNKGEQGAGTGEDGGGGGGVIICGEGAVCAYVGGGPDRVWLGHADAALPARCDKPDATSMLPACSATRADTGVSPAT